MKSNTTTFRRNATLQNWRSWEALKNIFPLTSAIIELSQRTNILILIKEYQIWWGSHIIWNWRSVPEKGQEDSSQGYKRERSGTGFLTCSGTSSSFLPTARTAVFRVIKPRKKKKSRVFGEVGSDLEFWGGPHEKNRVKERAKPFLSSRIDESRPNQSETPRHTIPKSSGFFLLAQVVLTILCPCQNPVLLFFVWENHAKKRNQNLVNFSVRSVCAKQTSIKILFLEYDADASKVWGIWHLTATYDLSQICDCRQTPEWLFVWIVDDM